MEINLAHGGIRAAAVTQGGELVSLRDGTGTEYIWGGDRAFWSGQNPVLFPIVGALKDGAVRFRDRRYEMDRHGFARRREFTLAERGRGHVVFELHEDAGTLAQYPYHFRLRVRHQLLTDGFYTEYEVVNTGGGDMPFCIGGHTAYRCPLHEGERFEDYRLVFDEPEDAAAIPVLPGGLLAHDRRDPALRDGGIDLDHHIFDRADTLIFEGLRSKGASLVHRDTGRGVHVSFGTFPMLGVWTPSGKNAPFICIEPWQGCASFDDDSGVFERKPYCVILSPGEAKRLRYTVTIL